MKSRNEPTASSARDLSRLLRGRLDSISVNHHTKAPFNKRVLHSIHHITYVVIHSPILYTATLPHYTEGLSALLPNDHIASPSFQNMQSGTRGINANPY